MRERERKINISLERVIICFSGIVMLLFAVNQAAYWSEVVLSCVVTISLKYTHTHTFRANRNEQKMLLHLFIREAWGQKQTVTRTHTHTHT